MNPPFLKACLSIELLDHRCGPRRLPPTRRSNAAISPIGCQPVFADDQVMEKIIETQASIASPDMDGSRLLLSRPGPGSLSVVPYVDPAADQIWYGQPDSGTADQI